MNDTARFRQFLFEDAEVRSGLHINPAIPVDAYIFADYARLENERLWDKVWQTACRVEELPEVGDFVTCDILDESIIVVRSAPDRIQAFYALCQHPSVADAADPAPSPANALDPRVFAAERQWAKKEGINARTTDTMVRAAEQRRRTVRRDPRWSANGPFKHSGPSDRCRRRRLLSTPTSSEAGAWLARFPQHAHSPTHHLDAVLPSAAERSRPEQLHLCDRALSSRPEAEHRVGERGRSIRQALARSRAAGLATMPFVQKRMKSRGFKGARSDPRQELPVYNFHSVLADYMGSGAPRPLTADQ